MESRHVAGNNSTTFEATIGVRTNPHTSFRRFRDSHAMIQYTRRLTHRLVDDIRCRKLGMHNAAAVGARNPRGHGSFNSCQCRGHENTPCMKLTRAFENASLTTCATRE